MEPLLGGLITGGASLLGSLFNSSTSASNTAATNAQSAANTQASINASESMMMQQENYETQMSNSAYQRAQADMKAAGLNPILAATNGGASTPSVSIGSAPTAQVQTPHTDYGIGPAVSQAISTAMGIEKLSTDLEKTRADTLNTNVDSGLKAAQQGLTGAEQQHTMADIARVTADVAQKNAETDVRRAELPKVRAESQNAEDVQDTPGRRIMNQLGFAGRKVSDVVSPISNLVSSARATLQHGF